MDLGSAVAASCAIPGVYQPVAIDGRRYVDGRLGSATNLDLLCGIGLDLVICVNPMSSPIGFPRPRGLVDRLLALAGQTMHRSLIADAVALRSSGTAVILIEPGPEDLLKMGFNLMNRNRSEFVMHMAERSVAEQLRVVPIRELAAERA